MNILDEIKSVVEVKINIKEDVLAQKLFDQAVDPLMLKLVGYIPTELDNAYYEGKKEELKIMFTELLTKEVAKIEAKIDSAIGEAKIDSAIGEDEI